MFFNKNRAGIVLASIALAALVGCGNDSSTNPEAGQFEDKGAFRVARPAVYASKDGINYYTYYWGSCTITNGVYSWDPLASEDLYAYTISNDTLKAYYRSADEYQNNAPLESDVDIFMFGNNSSIWGTWTTDYCRLSEGEYKCTPQLFNNTIEFKQDSLITYMTLNPNYNMVNEILHDIFHEYFDFCIDEEQEDYTSYYVDIPERGISFSYQDGRNATVNIQGQQVEVKTGGYTEPKAIHYLFSISSNGVTCSNESRFAYVNKAEYCSDAYKDYLTDDGYNEEGSGIISTHYLRDKGNNEEYTNCLIALFQNNPAYRPGKD